MKLKKLLFAALLLLVFCSFSSEKKQSNLKKPKIGVLINVIDHDYEKITDQQLTEISKTGYKTIELGAYNKALSPRFKKIYFDLKFNSLAIGSNLYDFQNNIDQWIEKALDMKMKYVICYWPWLDGAEHVTREQCLESAKIMNVCGEKCMKAGLKFAFHNHGIEFGKIDGEFIADVILKNTNPEYVSLELDIYHMLKSGNDPVPFMEKNARRIPILHLFAMDNKGKYPVVGEGMANFKGIIKMGKKIGVDYMILEGNDLADPMQFIEKSYAILNQLIGK